MYGKYDHIKVKAFVTGYSMSNNDMRRELSITHNDSDCAANILPNPFVEFIMKPYYLG